MELQWDGSKLFDVVIFNGNYADLEIEDKEVAGKDANGNDIKILQITVSDQVLMVKERTYSRMSKPYNSMIRLSLLV